MTKFINLIVNENMKIMHRPRLWVMIVLLIVSVLLMAIFINNGNQEAEQPTDLLGFVSTSTDVLFLAKIFAVILAGDIVASEFSWGTIKLLLIRPANRTKILLSKYLTVVLYTLFFMGVLLVSSILFGVLFFHGQPSAHPNLYSPSKIIGTYLFQFIGMVMEVTFAFMISTVFRSSSLAIGLSIFLMFTGNAFVQILHHFDVDWGKYLLYANTDFTQYLAGNQVLFQGMTIGFSIMMLCIYFVLFHFFSWISFIRRDIDV